MWVPGGRDLVVKVAKGGKTQVGTKKKKAESDRKAFLDALRSCGGNVFRAAKMVRIHEDMPYKWRRKDEQFAIAMEEEFPWHELNSTQQFVVRQFIQSTDAFLKE